MKWRRLVVIPFLVFAGSCARVKLPEATIASGKGWEPLTWDRAVQLALARHPDLLEARADLQSQAHRRNEALGAYLPTADASINRSRSNTEGISNSFSYSVDVSQPVFQGGEITGDALQAWHIWQAERWEYMETSARIRESLRTEFVELLRLYDLLEVNRTIAARRQDNADLLKLRYEAGREHEGSWRRAQAIAEQAAFEVRQIERRIESQSLALGRQLGGYFATPMPVAGELDALMPAAVEPPGDFAALADATPTVQSAMRTVDSFKAGILSAQSRLWPEVEATASYGASGDRPAEMDDETSVGLSVSVPLFAGGRNVQNVLASNAQYQSELAFARSTRDLRIEELSESWAAFQDAWELVAVRRSFLEAARKRAEIVRAQYTSGLASFQDFDIAEQELADSERNYVQSLADVLTREANWLESKGATLEEAAHAQ